MQKSFPKLSSSAPLAIFGVFPVIHKGYFEVLERYHQAYPKNPFSVLVLSRKSLPDYIVFEPDIRQLGYDDVARFLGVLPYVTEVHEIFDNNFQELMAEQIRPKLLVAFEHDESKVFLGAAGRVDFLTKEGIKVIYEEHLLHWATQDVVKQSAKRDHRHEENVSYHKKFLLKAWQQARHSGCFWRQVGALLLKDGKEVALKHNQMAPTPDECYKVGCVRDDIKPGERVELCSAIHAESAVIASAAKNGVSVSGATLYVTTFPCPICAKLIAFSGVKQLVYAEGWSTFDGERVLKSRGVEIIHIPLEVERRSPQGFVRVQKKS